jgi:hypothetical protein
MSAPQPQGKPLRPPAAKVAKVIPSEWKIELPKAGCIDDRLFGGCRSIEVGYEKKAMVGEGTYGEVSLLAGMCKQKSAAGLCRRHSEH